MKLRTTASLGLLLALAAGQAVAAGGRTLQLDVAPAAPHFTGADEARLPPVAPVAPRAPTFRPAPPARAPLSGPRQLGQRAMQNLIATSPEPGFEEPANGRLNLHFQKRGNALRDVQKGYRELCDRVSAKIWDEPNGKRVRFDVAGKPGLGVEIPLGRARKR
jgi:hypothetical protein